MCDMKRVSLETFPQPVSLRDVAAAAGVSTSTASRVLSGGRGASPRAVAAVLAAARQLDYRPNLIARGLRARSSGMAGIVVPGIGNPFFAELVEALEASLREAGLDVILADSRGDVSDEARRLEMLTDRQAAGLIMIPAGHHSSAAAMRRARRSVPIVQIDRQVDRFPADYVGVDNTLGIRLALEHLAAQGCRSVAFVSDKTASSTGRSRLDAFHLTVPRVAGLVAGPVLLGSFSMEFGRKAARELMSADRLPDAVVCGSDIIALGVVRELHQRSRTLVPDTVKVTGFDGILYSELCEPPLTTVRQPVETIAAEAVRLLQLRMDGNSAPVRRSEVAPALIVRRSSQTS
jgi:LacI family transcriptional regulator